jgi:hypothetical protein
MDDGLRAASESEEEQKDNVFNRQCEHANRNQCRRPIIRLC